MPTNNAAKRKKVERDEQESADAHELLLQLSQRSLSAQQKLELAASGAAGPLKPVCDGACRGNDKANPHCLCGWVPVGSGFRKKGLWQKEPGLLSGLGVDPRANIRGVRGRGRGCVFS